MRDRNHCRPPLSLLILLITFSLLPLLSFSKRAPPILFLTPDDLPTTVPDSSESLDSDSSEFPDPKSSSDLDPGSWLPLLDSEPVPEASLFYSGLSDLLEASSSGDAMLLEKASREIERDAKGGDPRARSVLGFMYQMGIGKKRDQAKAFLYHHFAANAGNFDSKMALAHTYSRQNMYEKSAQLYGELAEIAVSSFLISRDTPVIEPVRVHVGAEENKEALRKSRGEDDEVFQILEYQAQKGNVAAMYKMGSCYYFGLRGLRRDPAKALYWFLKAAEKVEPRSMELLGEIYIRGVGAEQNYTKALEWLTLAAKQQHYSAYNGIGYLYAKGYGVEMKNHTKAREFFEKAANNEDPGGYYNLGVLYLKGIGVKKDVKLACKNFLIAANAGQPKAFYQLAKMFHTGLGLKRSFEAATALYKLVAERGPWNSLFRWALEAYLKGDIGKASLLYSRLAELGYEVAQSNAAWILDKVGDPSLCLGASGLCMDTERHQRAHSLWWQASEQGNEHAALLIGDAYFYGKGTDRDYERAAEAYKHAKSQANAQALFNLGYMHEHGQGLPYDLHLAKRYYDEALETDPTATLPVTLALTSLWFRKNYADSFLVHAIDALPELFPKIEAWVENIIFDEGSATILTLVVCLLTVLYLRDWQRRNAAAAAPAHEPAPMPHFNERIIQAPQ